ncbi:glycosyltransferase family protein [Shumkonia mesophila]|uniref:glycosyltransferase family protein n=1 Tax=Shumkonia mesophila TaxID=2838854 RepID=UPI0029352E39|nr:glycosyltransferase family protein [Shumkonia mesophila]
MTRRTIVIVQARMTSTRLPGKVLMDLDGQSVLAHTLFRCAAIPGIDGVCCAIPEGEIHDRVAVEAKAAGAIVFRGAEHDVLDRYWRAALALGADIVMRVTSDCPLADPQICGQVLQLVADDGADYACNNMPPSWPHGLDCEAFTFDVLNRAANEAKELDQREHVTPWIRAHPSVRKANLTGPGGWVADQRWTLDFDEDLDFFRALFMELPPLPAMPSTNEILGVLRAQPHIAALNARHHNVSRPTVPAAMKENP